MDDDFQTLSQLVGDVEAFSREHWGRSPLHRRQAFGVDLLSIDGIEAMLLSGARRPTFRLVKAGEVLAPERSTRPVRLAGQVVTDMADLERIAAELAAGTTLVLQALQRTSSEIGSLCRQLEQETSHAVQANAYLTPPGAAGLAAHRDEHDVIVVQLEGQKAWEIEGLGHVDLTPGDVLYLPRGTRHSARAQQEPSLHLTLGLLSTTYGAVVRRVLSEPDALLDRPLPLGFTRGAGRARMISEMTEVLAGTAKRLESADVEPISESEAKRALTRRRPRLAGHLNEVLNLHRLSLDSIVRIRAHTFRRLTDDGSSVELELVDRTITFPAVARTALELLIGGQGVRVRDLPGIDEESRLVVVRRLVREGVLTVLGGRSTAAP